MQASQTPTLVPLAFAANGTKNTIPEASQIGVTPGAASLNDGFPPLTFTPIAAGGVPPAGADFNGILNLITASVRWAHGGGRYAFSSAFVADANVGGYPQGAVLMSADLQGSWLSLNDTNSDNPDTGAGTKWVPQHAYGTTAITGLAAANVTLTPAQAMKKRITLAGTLTANVQIIFPTWISEWIVVNNTTGAFTVTAKTSAGTGVALAAGQQKITGDGTNIVQPAESIPAATSTTQAPQMAQVAGVVGSTRNLAMSVTTASASATLTADEIIVETALGGVRYCLPSFSKTINLATTGAGGMDTGTAPVSGFVALYAIYNPTTGTSALLATNATSAAAPNVYGGANMPIGYTASALVSVWPTNSSGLLLAGIQYDRSVSLANIQALQTSTQASSLTALSISSCVPKNAKSISGTTVIGSTASSTNVTNIAGSSTGIGLIVVSNASSAASSTQGPYSKVQLITPQTIYYSATASAGTMNYTLNITSYDF